MGLVVESVNKKVAMQYSGGGHVTVVCEVGGERVVIDDLLLKDLLIWYMQLMSYGMEV